MINTIKYIIEIVSSDCFVVVGVVVPGTGKKIWWRERVLRGIYIAEAKKKDCILFQMSPCELGCPCCESNTDRHGHNVEY